MNYSGNIVESSVIYDSDTRIVVVSSLVALLLLTNVFGEMDIHLNNISKNSKKEAKSQQLTIVHVMQGFCSKEECSFEKLHLAEYYSEELHHFVNATFCQDSHEERVLA